MTQPISFCRLRSGLSARNAPRAVVSALFGLHALLLLCLFPAGAQSQQQSAGSEAVNSSFPGSIFPKQPVSEGLSVVAGAVLDLSGATVSGAEVRLTHPNGTKFEATLSQANGEFRFIRVLPGSYVVVVQAEGFALFTSAEFTVTEPQVYELPNVSLSVATESIEVLVRPSDLIAAEQVRAQEKQRIVGVIPNFYTSYVYNAAPLTWQQKFSLAARGTFDPVSMLGVGFAAGIEQANNTFPGYGQGAAGYSKRFAAKFIDGRSSDFLTHAVFPTLFHQDPRYFYRGTGSVKSRFLHAVGSAFVTRSDVGNTVPNYSYLLGDLSAGAISNLYYPQSSRGAHLVFTNAAVGLGGRIGGNLIREFLPRRFTTNVPIDDKP
ncbi:MAG: carboxypeptidase-like regulatory domain-containing protein [Candidatus Acidiferrum sp.]